MHLELALLVWWHNRKGSGMNIMQCRDSLMQSTRWPSQAISSALARHTTMKLSMSSARGNNALCSIFAEAEIIE